MEGLVGCGRNFYSILSKAPREGFKQKRDVFSL